MRIDASMTDEAVAGELGRRLARHRLARNVGQAELAEAAGVGSATLQRLEAGAPGSLTTFLRVLRALDLLEQLDRAVPEPPASPLEQLERQGRQRARARRPREADEGPAPWRWGDGRRDDERA
jgi:transcriptional regulator with XRE-family HTH domain